jgi:hypothetical protein
MYTTEAAVLAAIDEVADITLESSIDVYASLLNEYEKTAVILEEYNGNNIEGYTFFQEGAIGDEVKKMGEGQNAFVRILTLIPRLIVAIFRVVKSKLSKSVEKGKDEISDFTKTIKKIPKETKKKLFDGHKFDSKEVAVMLGLATVAGVGAKLTIDNIKHIKATKKTLSVINGLTKEDILEQKDVSTIELIKFIKSNYKCIDAGEAFTNSEGINVEVVDGHIKISNDAGSITSGAFLFRMNPHDKLALYNQKFGAYIVTIKQSSAEEAQQARKREEDHKKSVEKAHETKERNDKIKAAKENVDAKKAAAKAVEGESVPESAKKLTNALNSIAEFNKKYSEEGKKHLMIIDYDEATDSVKITESVSKTTDLLLDYLNDLESVMNGTGSVKKLNVKHNVSFNEINVMTTASPEACSVAVRKAYEKMVANEQRLTTLLDKAKANAKDQKVKDIVDETSKDKRKPNPAGDKNKAAVELATKISVRITTLHSLFQQAVTYWDRIVDVIHWVNACYSVEGQKADDYKAKVEHPDGRDDKKEEKKTEAPKKEEKPKEENKEEPKEEEKK